MRILELTDREYLAKAFPPGPQPQTPEARDEVYLQRMIDRYAAEGAPKKYDINEDWNIIDRVLHTMKVGEKLGEWYVRVGLGRAQIMTMTKEEITKFVEVVSRNEQLHDPAVFAPRVPLIPSSILA